jgi:hypothetical protein
MIRQRSKQLDARDGQAWVDHVMEVVSGRSRFSVNDVIAVDKRKLRSQPSVNVHA